MDWPQIDLHWILESRWQKPIEQKADHEDGRKYEHSTQCRGEVAHGPIITARLVHFAPGRPLAGGTIKGMVILPKYRWVRWPVLVAAIAGAIVSAFFFYIYLWAMADLGLELDDAARRWLNFLLIVFVFSSGVAIAILAWIVRDFLRRSNDT